MEERYWELGYRLNRIRQIRGETLTEVAQKVGVSPQFLSMVEKGRSGISINNLKKLARHYNESLAALIDQEAPAEGVIQLGTARKLYFGSGIESRLLTHDTDDEYFEPIYYMLQPGIKMGPTQHDGSEFTYMLEGHVQLELTDADGKTVRHDMHPGDSIHYPGSHWHSYENTSGVVAAFLSICTPRILQDKYLHPPEAREDEEK
ncbi:MAG: cupin domain-containing protein [Ruminococcaceae bacterium]|nr:cupin domain-containing protein [Oscillospiraceae bacterium]